MPFKFEGANSKRGLKFKPFFGDVNWKEYGGSFISKKLNNGEFDYWLIIEVTNLKDNDPDFEHTYGVALNVVAPSEVPEKELKDAAHSIGWDDDNVHGMTALEQVNVLAEYGIYATIWHQEGNNLQKLLREAHSQANGSQMMFGFMMDEPRNRLGATGWDCIKGNLIPNLAE